MRIRRGCSFHGIAFNVDMDLSPFARINPCGYAGMTMTQLRDLRDVLPRLDEEATRLVRCLANRLGGDDNVHECRGMPAGVSAALTAESSRTAG